MFCDFYQKEKFANNESLSKMSIWTYCRLFLQSQVLQSAKISPRENVHEDKTTKINSGEKMLDLIVFFVFITVNNTMRLQVHLHFYADVTSRG